jgi:hypothetical protein
MPEILFDNVEIGIEIEMNHNQQFNKKRFIKKEA